MTPPLENPGRARENISSVYAIFGGKDNRAYPAYVGLANRLKRRIIQHLIKRNSSVTSAIALVRLNPDNVTELRWWLHPLFSEKSHLEAAELVAFDVLKSVLRSHGCHRR